jgi:hypothetical protein
MPNANSRGPSSWLGRNSFFLTFQLIVLVWGLYEWDSEPFIIFAWIACWIAFGLFLLIHRLTLPD